MREVSDWAFLHPAASARIEVLDAERVKITKELVILARRRQSIVQENLAIGGIQRRGNDDLEHVSTESDQIEIREKKYREHERRVHQERLRLEPETEELAPGAIVEEVISSLECLLSLLCNPGPSEEEDQKYLGGGATRWLARELRALGGTYIKNRAYTFNYGKPGAALRFAHEASKIVLPAGIPPQVLRDFWQEQDRQAKEENGVTIRKR